MTGTPPINHSGWDLLLSEFENNNRLTHEQKKLLRSFISFVIDFKYY